MLTDSLLFLFLAQRSGSTHQSAPGPTRLNRHRSFTPAQGTRTPIRVVSMAPDLRFLSLFGLENMQSPRIHFTRAHPTDRRMTTLTCGNDVRLRTTDYTPVPRVTNLDRRLTALNWGNALLSERSDNTTICLFHSVIELRLFAL